MLANLMNWLFYKTLIKLIILYYYFTYFSLKNSEIRNEKKTIL